MFNKNLKTIFFTLSFSFLFLIGANPLQASSGSINSSLNAPIVKTVDQKKPKKITKSKAVKKTKSAKKKATAKKGKMSKQAKKKTETKVKSKKTVKSLKKNNSVAKKGVKRASQKKMKQGKKRLPPQNVPCVIKQNGSAPRLPQQEPAANAMRLPVQNTVGSIKKSIRNSVFYNHRPV